MAKVRDKGLVDRLAMLNWSFIFFITITSFIGFAVLYSAAQGNLSPWASSQMIKFSVLFPFMLLIALIDLKFWFRISYVLYAMAFLAIIATEFFGFTAMGATRWLRVGPVSIQPSEIMKVCEVFALARYFQSINPSDIGKITFVIPPIIMVLAPAAFVLKQPDLGTALILIFVGGALFFVAGVRIWKFVVVLVGGIIALPFAWGHLHDYQKNRFLSFLSPESDPLGNGYNILQSKIAIGSGGFLGKGFLKGTQGQLSFLPEKQTDFIFTMFTEEFGFVGGATVIFLYLTIITYGIFIALDSKSHFGRLMAMGLISCFFFHACINIAMVMGLIPIVGVPLPLLSYGGSIMMTMLVSFGLILNVSLYKDEDFD